MINCCITGTITRQNTNKSNRYANIAANTNKSNEGDEGDEEPAHKKRRMTVSLNYSKFQTAPSEISTNFISIFAETLREDYDAKEKGMYEVENTTQDQIDGLNLTADQLKMVKIWQQFMNSHDL